MAKNTPNTVKQDEITQELLNWLTANAKKPTIREQRIANPIREGEKLDRIPLAINTGAVKPDTLTSALNRIMIASDPQGWERLHDYDYDGDEFTDEGDFESETDFISENKSERGHYDKPKTDTNSSTPNILETEHDNNSQNKTGKVDNSQNQSNKGDEK